jgi:hypothetical protein
MSSKELSPGPQKWSPNISKATPVFQFCKAEVVVKKTGNDVIAATSTSGSSVAQRKRKDSRSNSEHADSKKISRSSR